MLDVTITRDKYAYFVFILELILSLTTATYQLGVRVIVMKTRAAQKLTVLKKKEKRTKEICQYVRTRNDICVLLEIDENKIYVEYQNFIFIIIYRQHYSLIP